LNEDPDLEAPVTVEPELELEWELELERKRDPAAANGVVTVGETDKGRAAAGSFEEPEAEAEDEGKVGHIVLTIPSAHSFTTFICPSPSPTSSSSPLLHRSANPSEASIKNLGLSHLPVPLVPSLLDLSSSRR
jgi:hypothetical protein